MAELIKSSVLKTKKKKKTVAHITSRDNDELFTFLKIHFTPTKLFLIEKMKKKKKISAKFIKQKLNIIRKKVRKILKAFSK